MNMLETRYSFVRRRLIELYQILEHRAYPIWIAPEFMMTTEQLRDRYEYKKEGYANDTNFYSEPQLREMKVPQLFPFLENIRDHTNIGVKYPNKNVTEIYESIQEYLSLWCELMRTNMYRSPSMTELRKLESIAYLIFPYYKQIKPYRRDQEINERFKEDQGLQEKGLSGFAALFGLYRLGASNQEEISFVSHLNGLTDDTYLPTESMSHQPRLMPSVPLDSLASVDSSLGNPDWIFKG